MCFKLWSLYTFLIVFSVTFLYFFLQPYIIAYDYLNPLSFLHLYISPYVWYVAWQSLSDPSGPTLDSTSVKSTLPSLYPNSQMGSYLILPLYSHSILNSQHLFYIVSFLLLISLNSVMYLTVQSFTHLCIPNRMLE